MLPTSTESKKQKSFLKKAFRISFVTLLCLGIIGLSSLFIINAHVKNSTKDRILNTQEAAALEDVDCILVLGCGVLSNGQPSAMLRDRLLRGIELYEEKAAPKIIMSGDHGRKDYDEVNTMKQYAIDAGIPSEDIFMDHAGFSTYESMYRARDIFKADKILIVSQEYHLYRGIYIAQELGIEAYGVSSDYHTYAGQTARDVREVLARCKDFATGIFQPKPTFLGEAIPVNGDGNLTNDK